MRYHISNSDECLAITGMGIRSVRITKADWVWPFQRCTRFSVQPHDYAMDLQVMTVEKLQFSLPVVFIVGPDVNRRGANGPGVNGPGAGFKIGGGPGDPETSAPTEDSEDRGYAVVNAKDESHQTAHVANIVRGIIEGETRVLVTSMTMEDIFTERDVLKRRIFRNIQAELGQFGLKVYNANVKELKDAPGFVYFGSLSRKAHEGATNQARIEVAEAQLRGTDREIAKINFETAVQKTDRDVERAEVEARLNTTQAGLDWDVNIARVSAERALESRNEDLKREVKLKRTAAELEHLRASTSSSTPSSPGLLKGTHVELAKANADAVRGLEPKISIWNTDPASNAGAGGDDLDAMRNVYQMLPPLMTTIHDQTGITLPEWQFGRINAGVEAMRNDGRAASP